MSEPDLLFALINYLEAMRKMREIVRDENARILEQKIPPCVFTCGEDLVLKHGRAFPRSLKRPPIPRRPRACFEQAYSLALRPMAKWLYCEGYAIPRATGVPVHHAWVTPAKSPGEAHELAWRGKLADAVYYGIAFQADFVRNTFYASEREWFGVIEAWWTDYALLTGAVLLETVQIAI